ncbi:restriction endonuclease subunit S, partial [bacterium]|nr:restriction endonuclease subunit S [bacterium]
MGVKSGYKQTEVGVIPEDWEVHTLRSCLSAPPDYGINAPAVPFSYTLPTYVRITDITEDGRFSSKTPASIKHPDAENYYLNVGEIVFARTGASVGKSYLYKNEDGKLVFAGFLIRVRPNVNKLIPTFLAEYIKTGPYWNWVRLMSMRSGQHGVNGAEYGQLPIPLPPTLTEQSAIATALSDADALIQSLERLIAKKRDIKQGAMQELLTGKKRLPGFEKKKGCKQTDVGVIPEDWDTKKLGDIFSVSAGGDLIKDAYQKEYDEKHPYPIYSNALTDKGLYGYSRIYRHENNCITVTARGTIGYANMRNHKFDAIGRLLILQQILCADCHYISEFINKKISFSIESTGVPQLTAPHIAKYKVAFPEYEEQTAIATVLSDMDAEIAALDSKLAKARQIKQGMMQEL